MSEDLKRRAAEAAAAAELRSGMLLGLGTGSTARHFVDIVGARIRAGETYRCVPTSEATRAQAEALAIPLTTLDDIEEIDLTVDGADAFDPALNLVKGGGGALLREKMVAAASKRMVVIADASKAVAQLGAFPLPVEIVRFAHGATARAVRRAFAAAGIACEPRLRRGATGEPSLTDNGNFILDCVNPGIPDPPALALRLGAIPGVVEHGLFIGLCSAVYLAREEGVAVIERKS
ncbi:ribose-5-phosphate isomerase RpiA [Rhabdaerophilum calidifontis]|uniref:ribose-5-phosphate isomerase RpiA n=1 Tax=Rhabdaerophilum calidifontis TaxID=2604328 RepID=UPI0012397301|nr:ribose-5-phosphate isomerase RpiA [Rhabdaerophilum calidifontis]